MSVPPLRLLSPAEIEALPDLEYLIEGILPVPAFGVLFGPPGAGKSFIALSMALAVAAGEDWLGRPTKEGGALYVAAEGALGLKKRLAAHRKRFGINDDNIRFIGEPFDVRTPAKVEELSHAVEKAGFEPALIIVDTLARVAVGAEENSAKDMGQVVDGFETLKRQTEATVLVIHHTRKTDGMERGSSALRGAADVMIKCEKPEASGPLSVADLICDKMKDDAPFASFGVMFEQVALPDGKSSLVVSGSGDVSRSKTKGLNKHQKTIMDILVGEMGNKGATHAELKRQFIETGSGSESTFNRSLKQLRDSGEIIHDADLYFAKHPERYDPGSQERCRELRELFADARTTGTTGPTL